MTKQDIVSAYVRIRTIDQTIPDDVLDFMKDAAIEKLEQIEMKPRKVIADWNEANHKTGLSHMHVYIDHLSPIEVVAVLSKTKRVRQ